MSFHNMGPGPGFEGGVGTPGKSAYELAQELGYAGTLEQWLASLAAPGPVIYQEEINVAAAAYFAAHPVPIPTLHVGYGLAELPLLVKDQQVTVTVSLDQAMPHTGYTVKTRAILGNRKLNTLQVTVGTKTKSALDLTLKATAAIAVGGIIYVDCFALA